MTQELIINGVNWLDPWFIGKECWFGEEIKGKLEAVSPDSNLPFKSSCDDYGNDRYDECRLLQGDKTPYDGKGQPVPDGVVVKVWFTVRNGVDSYIAEASNFDWSVDTEYRGNITHYQVQEQKLEPEQFDFSLIPVKNYTRIPIELLQRIDVALDKAKKHYDSQSFVDRMLHVEAMVEIDSLRKQLSEVV